MAHQTSVRRNDSRQLGNAGAPPVQSLVGRWVAGALNGLQGGVAPNGGGVPAPLPENGASVANWVPVFGTLLPFTQKIPGDRPTFVRPNGGAPAAVRFTATKTLSSAIVPPLAADKRTMFLIGSNWTATVSQDLLRYGTMGTPLQGFGFVVSASGFFAYDVGTGTGGATSPTLAPPTTPVVLMLSFDGTNALFQAGTVARTAEARVLNTVASLPLTLGGAVGAFDAHEVLLYDAALSDAQIDVVGAYATGRYGAPRLL
jgi:hypothetical protein